MKDSYQQVRSIQFTLHVGGIDLVAQDLKLQRIFKEEFPTKYWCYGEENGKHGDTPHWQGYAAFTKRVSFKKLGHTLGCHIESAKGNASQNKAYCSKEGGPFHEWGNIPEVSKKFSHADAIQAAREDRMEDIEQEAPQLYLQYRSQLERVHLECYQPSVCFKVCYWLVGKPGTGKSRFAYAYHPGSTFIKPPNKWVDGWNPNYKVMVVNDVDHSNASKLSYFLKIWADLYPLLAEVKGGSLYLTHETVFVTSNYRINQLYPNDHELQIALHRRYKEIVVLDHRETPIGEIEIKTFDEFRDDFNGGQIKWINQHNIKDY